MATGFYVTIFDPIFCLLAESWPGSRWLKKIIRVLNLTSGSGDSIRLIGSSLIHCWRRMGDLFEGLPPPLTEQAQKVDPSPVPAPLPAPPLKSALKRPKFEDSVASSSAPALKSALKKPKFDDPAPALKSALKKPKFDESAPVPALKSALKQSNSDVSNPPGTIFWEKPPLST